jgi:hypothetical protein
VEFYFGLAIGVLVGVMGTLLFGAFAMLVEKFRPAKAEKP